MWDDNETCRLSKNNLQGSALIIDLMSVLNCICQIVKVKSALFPA